MSAEGDDDEDVGANPSTQTHMSALIESRLSRRNVLQRDRDRGRSPEQRRADPRDRCRSRPDPCEQGRGPEG